MASFSDWTKWGIPDSSYLQNTLNILLPFTGIFIALLALWAQITIRISLVKDENDNYKESNRRGGTIALFWIYMAIGIAVFALAIFVFTTQSSIFRHIGPTTSEPTFGAFVRYLIYRIGLGFLLTSFLMFFAHIIESTVSLYMKVRRGKTLISPLLEITDDEYRGFINSLICMTLLLGIFSLTGILLGWRYPICFVLWVGDIAIIWWAIGRYYKRVRTEKRDHRKKIKP